MDAREFFRTVAKPNYEQFIGNPSDLRLLWNAVVSLNTVAEFLALDRLKYQPVTRSILDNAAADIRKQFPILSDLNLCAVTFKHVRKIPRSSSGEISTLATSTGISSGDQTRIGELDVVTVLHNAFETISSFAEFK
jgi:hypothetical protein